MGNNTSFHDERQSIISQDYNLHSSIRNKLSIINNNKTNPGVKETTWVFCCDCSKESEP